MSYKVNILEQAEQDILDIYYYVAYNDGESKALHLLDKLEDACLSLDGLTFKVKKKPFQMLNI